MSAANRLRWVAGFPEPLALVLLDYAVHAGAKRARRELAELANREREREREEIRRQLRR